MKVLGAAARPVTFRLREGYRIAGHHFTSADNVILKVDTGDGRTGFGCAAPFEEVTGESPAASLAALADRLIPLMLESDVEDAAALQQRVMDAAPGAPAARAACDMALLDLQAQRAGVPLCRLLGARRARLPTSVTLGIADDIGASVERARRYVAEGFHVLKIKVGEDPEHDLRHLEALRRALGPGIVLRADANQGYSEDAARRFLQAAASLRLELLEQPIPASDEAGLRRLTSLRLLPIMADESLCSEADGARLAADHVVDLFNIKLMKAGGVTPALRLARLAERSGLGVMYGCNDESRISIAAALHAALASPATERVDLDGHLDLQDDVARGGVRLRDGCLEPVDAPGLGVVVDA